MLKQPENGKKMFRVKNTVEMETPHAPLPNENMQATPTETQHSNHPARAASPMLAEVVDTMVKTNNPQSKPTRSLPPTPNQGINGAPSRVRPSSEVKGNLAESSTENNFLVKASNENLINFISILILNLTKEKSEADIRLLIRTAVESFLENAGREYT